MTRVVILGGGFGGIYAALGFEKLHDEGFEVTLVDRDNFFLFTPMLSEIAAGSIDATHAVNPIRRMFRRVRFMQAEVESVDFTARCVQVRLPPAEQAAVPYEHLVIALGSVPNYFNLPGVRENALPMKTLADAVAIRNRTIQRLEEADVREPGNRAALLTWVVAGGGLSGVEVAGDLNDFVRQAASAYPTIDRAEPRIMLIEAGPGLMPELSLGLGEFARRKLMERGVDVRLNAPVLSASADSVDVQGMGKIPTLNLIWTAGIAPTPFVRTLGLPLEKGRIPTDEYLRVPSHPNVWALGDVARIPDGKGGYHPPTAQHAVREGRRLARNIAAVTRGRAPAPFRYGTMGMLATVGHRSGVGEIFQFKISGFLAWWMWRSYYLLRLPRIEKRVRVMLDWSLDLIFPRDIVQLKMGVSSGDGTRIEERY